MHETAMTDSHAQPGSAARNDTTLLVSELFVSVQGEGRLAGTPSRFIRLSGCNLRCKWCDTPYASWRPESTAMTVRQIIEAPVFTGPRGVHVRHAVVTGGEPMMFPGVVDLCAALKARGMHVTIETAGTIDRDVPCDLLSVSPKLSNSTPSAQEAVQLTARGDALAGSSETGPGEGWSSRHEERRLNLPALGALLARYPEHQVKFVVKNEQDLAEIEDVLARLRALGAGDRVEPADVLLMPEGTPPTQARMQWAAEACIARGWRYCHRVHQDVYGNRRGT